MEAYHIPVLLRQSVDLLGIRPEGIYADVTFGGGGHTREILSRLGPAGRGVAFDRDPDARQNLPADDRLIFVPLDFKFIEHALREHNLLPLDGILADLGVSSHQFDTPDRGFSFRFEAPLDMRMNPLEGETAADLLREAEPETLIRIFRDYGELDNARRVVSELVRAREHTPIRTTRDLELAVRSCLPPRGQSKYLAQLYQALRIVVNHELEALETLLEAAPRLLKPGGVLSVIAYHSLEDRLVKHFLRSGNREDVLEKDFYGNPLSPWELITRKAIQPSDAEIEVNPRARSARLRAAKLKGPNT
ncbi:MAG: 16S rRNA (cytosine(1402)-N(4))-methyltransferase RsmH [Bacteroidetes bacterium]|nr:MAG: 16S rRNA (cytosine(1402)-N(4))-methyltransferase RsmH [Bacteroidota bacterium]